MILIGIAHSPEDQGATVQHNGEILSEHLLSRDVVAGIAEVLRDQAVEHRVLEGTLLSRIREAQAAGDKCELILEPHFDCFPGSPEMRGYYCLVRAGCEEAIRAANSILSSLAPVSMPRRKSGLCFVSERKRWFGDGLAWDDKRLGLLHDCPCPALIVECGYLSNQMDRWWLASRSNRVLFGNDIGWGIVRWIHDWRNQCQ